MRSIYELFDLLRVSCHHGSKLRKAFPGKNANSRKTACATSCSRHSVEPLEQRRLLSAVSGNEATPLYMPAQYHLWSPGGYLSSPSQGSAIDVAMSYLASHAADMGVSAADISSSVVTDAYRSPDLGLTHVYLCEQYNGIQIVNARLNVNVGDDGRVLSADGGFVPLFSGVHSLAASQSDTSPVLTANEARDAAIKALNLGGVSLAAPGATAENKSPAAAQQLVSAADSSTAGQSDTTLWENSVGAALAYVATPTGLALTWDMVLETLDHSHCYDVNVNSNDGQLLGATDWVDHASYNVFALPTENPNDGSRTILTDPADPAASPYGWHDTNGSPGAEYTDTRGNNAFVAVNGAYPSGGATLNFDFPLDLAQTPSGYSNAAATNLFYLVNMAHDLHYHYGFTEAAGNFQQTNYTGLGVGGDPVQAVSQDSSDIDNAYMSTPPDGQSPTMSMGLFDYTTPGRDAELESTIVLHEYGHGVSNRLVGGPSNANALDGYQSGGMGEGWSDWWGLMFTQKPTDTKMAAYPVGTYVIGQSPTGGGIRRYPYSVNMTTDPETYGWYNSSNEVHNVGEIWCSTLWDLNWALIDKYGYSPNVMAGYSGPTSAGNILALQLVEDSLKLMPVRPTFLNSRDAILQADQALTGGANQGLIWQVFARRGMGYSANDGGSDVATTVTEAFDVPAFQVIHQTPSGVATTPPTSIDFQFSKNIDPLSFSIADDVDSFTSPGGTDLLPQIAGYSFPAPDTLRLTFNPQTDQGAYTIVIGPNILAADGTGAMDQNQNGTPGEPGDVYSGQFRYDAHVMQVESTTPAVGSVLTVAPPTLPLRVTFDEAYSPASLGADDLTLSQGSVASFVAIDPTTVEYELAGISQEGTLTVSMAAGAVSDAFGNPGAAFSGTYSIDIITAGFPTPLTPESPLGSLVYDGSVAGYVNTSSDTDSYTIALDAGQTLTAFVVPTTTLRPTVAINGPGGISAGPVTATAAGKQAFIQTLTAATAGTYTITVSSAASTTGQYTLQLVLNAAVETESHDGPTNNNFSSAQSLDSAFVPLGGTAARAAVLGITDPTRQTIVSWNMNSNPGWTFSSGSQWAWGQPTGAGGDPTSGYTGTNVVGYNLAGQYPNSMTTTYYATTPAFSTVGKTGTQLSFWRWLGVESSSYDHATIDVSTNGTTWTSVWANGSTTISDTAWSLQTFDISAVADNKATVYLRWGMGPTDSSVTYCGWNLDDVTVTAAASNLGDYYNLTLAANESATIALASLGADNPVLELYDSTQHLVTTGAAAANITRIINNFQPGPAGVYYVHVTGSGLPYNLVVTKNADFDTEPNDSLPMAQSLVATPLGISAAALGYIEPAVSGVEPDDYASGTTLTNVVPGITLSVQGASDVVTSQTSSYTSTGNRVFGDGSSVYFSDTVFLRAAFATPVASVSLDLVPDDSYDPGFLKAYSASGVLLQDLETAAPPFPGFLTMTITRPSADIAYILAGGQSGQAILLDHLVVNGGAGGSDYYRISVTAGDALMIATKTPGAGPNQILNLLDPKIELYDPAGSFLASDDNGAADGRNALLSYTALSTGSYKVRVLAASAQQGEYLLSIQGATGASPPFSVVAASPASGVRLNHQPGTLTLSLNDSVLLSSVQNTDLVIDGGASTVSAVSSADGRTLSFTLPTLSEGTHTFTIATGAMIDIQNTPIQAFSTSLLIDLTGPRLTASSVTENAVLPAGSLVYNATFSEDMDTTVLNASDFALVGGRTGSQTATVATWIDPRHLRLQFASLADDTYTLTLYSGAGYFQDLAGNALDGEPHSPFSLPSGDGTPGGNFFVHFSADVATGAFPVPLTSVSPLGSLVYTGSVQGTVATGSDTDSYTVDLAAGQTLTAVVTPGTGLQPMLSMTGPGGLTAGPVTGAGSSIGTITEKYYASTSDADYLIPLDSGGGLLTRPTTNPVMYATGSLPGVLNYRSDGSMVTRAVSLSSTFLNTTNYYGAVFQGQVTFTAAGWYTFVTGSDDGSVLYIDWDHNGILDVTQWTTSAPSGELIVNNNYDQAHTYRGTSVQVSTPGTYGFSYGYREGTGGNSFNALWAPGSLISSPNSTLSGDPPAGYSYIAKNGSITGASILTITERYYAGLSRTAYLIPLSSGSGLLTRPTSDPTTYATGALSGSLNYRTDGSMVTRARTLSPTFLNSTDNYGAVFQGQVTFSAAGYYTFVTGSDDGSVLYIDWNKDGVMNTTQWTTNSRSGELIVNNHYPQGHTYRATTVQVTTPGTYSFAYGYLEGLGGNSFNALWAAGNLITIPNTILSGDPPAGYTYVASNAVITSASIGTITERYYAQVDCINPLDSSGGLLTRPTSNPATYAAGVLSGNLNYRTDGSMVARARALDPTFVNSTDNYGAVFQGQVTFSSAGWYTFVTGSDDGSVLYVDWDHNGTLNTQQWTSTTTSGELIVSNEHDQLAHTYKGTSVQVTTPDTYNFVFGFRQGTVANSFNALWAPGNLIGTPNTVLSGDPPAGYTYIASNSSIGGKQAFLQTVTAATAGTYTITVGSAAGTTGDYSLQLTLNAAVEAESHDGPTNNTAVAAQNIDGSFVSLGGGASRGSVLGTADPSLGALPAEVEPNNTISQANSAAGNFAAYSGNLYHLGIAGTITSGSDQDWFKIGTLDPGDVISVLEGAAGSSRGTLGDSYVSLYRYNSGSPLLVTSNDDSGPGADSLIYRYSVTTADVYYVVALPFSSSYTGTYALGLLLENTGTAPLTGGALATETEPNDSAATANDASTSWRPVQYLSRTTAAVTSGDVDVYSYHFTAGDLISVDIHATSTTTWRPMASLLNSAGTVIAVEDGTSSGPTADSWLYSFVVPTTGTYYVQTQSYTGTGTYNADVYLSTSTAPPVAAPGNDYYSFTLGAGDSVSLGLLGLPAGAVHLSLENAGGTILASGISGATNLTEVTSRFTAGTAGTYYAHITAAQSAVPYNLIVTKNAAFDTEPNDTASAAQNINGTSGVLGGISTSSVTLTMDEVPYQAVNGLTVKGVTFGFTIGGVASASADYNSGGPGTTTYTQDPSIEGDATGVLSWTFAQAMTSMQFGLALSTSQAVSDGATVSLYTPNGTLIGTYPVAIATNGYTYSSGLFSYSGPALVGSCSVSFNSSVAAAFVVDNLVSAGSDSDWYSITVPTTNRSLHLTTSTPSDGGGQFANVLSPHIELYDATGTTLLGTGVVGADGRNENLNYTPLSSASFLVRVSSKSGTSGEYFLHSVTTAVQPPAVTVGNTGAIVFIRGGAAVVTAPVLTLTDPSNDILISATVALSGGPLDAGAEILSATTTGTAITANYDAGTGILSLSGSDTLTHYQQVLRSVSYVDTMKQTVNTGNRTLVFTISDTNNASTPDTGAVVFDIAPQVVAVYVSGSTWNPGLLSVLAAAGVGDVALGFKLVDGGGQLANANVLGWINADTISIVFSKPVSGVALSSLSLGDSGNNGGSTSGITVNHETKPSPTVATFTLSGPLTSNKYYLALAAAGIGDSSGGTLDGEWTTGVSTFAAGSGDGAPGGNFNFRFNVLTGDVNGDGQVGPADLNAMRTQPLSLDRASNWRYDVNGDGKVGAGDANAIRTQPAVTIDSFPEPLLPALNHFEAAANMVSSWASSTFSPSIVIPGMRNVTGDGVVLDWASGGTVKLDGASPSLADVTFNSTGSYNITQGSGGTLQLDGGTSPATITVTVGRQSISAPVSLESDVRVLPAGGTELVISGDVQGAGKSLTVDGAGTVVLAGTNSYTGGTTVYSGTLVLANPAAIADDTSLTVGADASLIFSSPLGMTPSALAMAATVASTTSVAISESAGDLAVQVTAAVIRVPAASSPLALPPNPQGQDVTDSIAVWSAAESLANGPSVGQTVPVAATLSTAPAQRRLVPELLPVAESTLSENRLTATAIDRVLGSSQSLTFDVAIEKLTLGPDASIPRASSMTDCLYRSLLPTTLPGGTGGLAGVSTSSAKKEHSARDTLFAVLDAWRAATSVASNVRSTAWYDI